jgi:hypothetical protein
MPALAVGAREFHAFVRAVPFVALPREEIDRLYGAIEVLAVDDDALRTSAGLLALHGYIAVHHNYTWLTFPRHDGQRTLLLSAALPADGPAPLFLGDELSLWARRTVEGRLRFSGGYEVRLAGILQDAESAYVPPRAGLLWIARLASRIASGEAECLGNVELRVARSQFDARSRVVIDHLAAL